MLECWELNCTPSVYCQLFQAAIPSQSSDASSVTRRVQQVALHANFYKTNLGRLESIRRNMGPIV